MVGFDLSPQLGLRHSNVTVDAYQESGSRLLDLSVSDHSLRSNLATVGVRMDSSFVMGDVNVLPQLDVDYQHELSGEGETIMASLPSGQDVNGVSEVGSRKALKVKFGLSLLFSEKTRLTAQLQKRFADEGGNSLLANITLTHAF
jgi:outer membrane autotransporter protein